MWVLEPILPCRITAGPEALCGGSPDPGSSKDLGKSLLILPDIGTISHSPVHAYAMTQ